MANEGGAKLGIARGIIELVTDRFQKSAAIIQSVSRQVGTSVETIGASADKASKQANAALSAIATSFDRAQKAAKVFNETPLGKIQSGLDAVAKKIQTTSLAAGVLTGLGVKAAQDLKTLTTSIELLSGSQQKANEVMAKTRQLADEFHSPYIDLLSGARAFLPLAKATNTDIQSLLKTAIKFQAYAPQKTFAEIKFSINEAISGDFVSIKDALDLSRKQRDELKKAFEENGPQAVLAGINDILEKRGFDDETIKKFGESGANAFAELRSEVQETLATAFMPLLTDVILPLVKQFSEFIRNLRETNPEILKIGAGVTVIVAALYPLTTILTTLIGLWKGVAVAAAFAGLTQKKAGEQGKEAAGGMVGKLAKGGLAIAGGVGVGLAGATALANAGVRSGDLGRIAAGESAGDILGERIKQIIVIFAKGVIELGRLLAKAGAFIWNAIDQVVNAFKFLGTFLREFGGNLQKALGDILVGISQLIAKIPGAEQLAMNVLGAGGQLQQAGILEAGTAQADRDRLSRRLAEGFTVPQSTLDSIDKTFDDISNTVVGGLTNFLFPVEQAAEVTADSLKTTGEVLGSIAESVFNAVKGVFENIVNAVTDTDSEEFLKKQAEDITTATKKYNEDILNLENERLQSLSEVNQKFADDQVKIAQDAADASRHALDDLIADRDRLNTDFTRDSEKDERERQRKIRNKLIEAQRQEVEDTQKHAVEMAAERERQRKQEQDALLDLDFKRLFEMSTDNAGKLAGDNQEFANQRKARNTALQNELADMQTAFNDERDERLIKFQQDLSDRSAQYQTEQAQIQQQTAQKQQALATAHNTELQQIQSKYQTELQLRQQAMQQELQLLVMSEKQRNAFLLAEQQKYMTQAVALAQQFGLKLSQSLQGAYAPNQLQVAAKTISDSPLGKTAGIVGNALGNAVTNIGNAIFGNKKASGGYMPAVVNESGSSQMERWMSGGRSYDLGGTAILTPLRGGRVDPNRGGGQPIQVNINLNAPIDSGILTVPEALTLIRNAGEEVKLQLLQQMYGGQ